LDVVLELVDEISEFLQQFGILAHVVSEGRLRLRFRWSLLNPDLSPGYRSGGKNRGENSEKLNDGAHFPWEYLHVNRLRDAATCI
jgi:hypothetical protein